MATIQIGPRVQKPVNSRGEQTRNRILEAARTLFYRRGYARTSFTDIVNETQIRRGNINHYFRTKRDILEAVIDQNVDEYRRLFRQWEQDCPEPRDRLHRFVDMVAANSNNLIRYGCPIGTLGSELGKDSSDFSDGARRLFDTFADWLATQFELLGKKADARRLALHLLCRTEGISIVAHVYNDPALIEAEIEPLHAWIDAL